VAVEEKTLPCSAVIPAFLARARKKSGRKARGRGTHGFGAVASEEHTGGGGSRRCKAEMVPKGKVNSQKIGDEGLNSETEAVVIREI
jgi:hypothetical protein